MKKYLGIRAHLFLIVIGFSSAACFEQNEHENIYLMAKRIYSPVISSELKKEKNQEFLEAKENAYQMATFKQKRKLVVNTIQVPKVGDAEKINLMFSMLSLSSDAVKKDNFILNENVFKDLEMLSGYAPDFGRSIFARVDYTKTVAGLVQFQKMLCTPTVDIQELSKRQYIIRTLIENPQLRENLEKRLKVIHEVENELIWMWKEVQVEIWSYFEEAYFQTSFLTALNKSEIALEVESVRIFLMPLVQLLIPNIMYCLITGLQRANGLHTEPVFSPYAHGGLLIYSSLMYALQKVFFGVNVFAPAINHFTICDKLQGKMMNISSYVRAVNALGKIIASDKELARLFPDFKNLVSAVVVGDEAKALIESLQTDTFKGSPSFFSNYGRVLAGFKILQDVKNNIVNALAAAGDIDTYVALANLYLEHESKNGGKFCFVDFENLDKPHVKLEGFWHPMLDPKKVVTNDWEIGTEDGGANVILTGPNAGGKSTALKAAFLAVWFAQATGLAPAHAMALTPFTRINSYLNITDSQGRESLFQAEMHRAQALLADIKALKPSEFCFVIMDEIFTGTNPKEGEAAAYGVAKRLSDFSNNMAIVATHFKALTDLEVATDGLFKNYKVSVEKCGNRFVYPYKLESGMSDQPIALQLLEHEGFDDEILQQAQAIMARSS